MTALNASSISAKYSGAPNCRAKRTNTGASSISMIVAKVPAKKEPMAAVASAAPARPFLAILLPSMAVTMLAVSPGVLSKIEVVEPPYMAP